jgi:hypothetical protein
MQAQPCPHSLVGISPNKSPYLQTDYSLPAALDGLHILWGWRQHSLFPMTDWRSCPCGKSPLDNLMVINKAVILLSLQGLKIPASSIVG